MTTSWVVVRREDGIAVFETFDRTVAENINDTKYVAVPIREYLASLNQQQ